MESLSPKPSALAVMLHADQVKRLISLAFFKISLDLCAATH